jgi:hypothetical protein
MPTAMVMPAPALAVVAIMITVLVWMVLMPLREGSMHPAERGFYFLGR